MGCLTPSETILEGIQRNALNAAFKDPRFPALTAPELEEAEIEISILTSPQELQHDGSNDLLAKLRPNIDGVIISKGLARATFLPQVWEQLPRTEDFLAHLCRKAGLSFDEWQKGELDVATYQVQYFHEKS
jgi:AmmeMemoRadiSam system protein A